MRPLQPSAILRHLHLSCLIRKSILCPQRRTFISTPPQLAKNRIFTSVRSLGDFNNYLLLSASNRTALISFWTASWCPSCKIISPIIKDLIENEGAGEKDGGVSYAEVEIDSPNIGDLAMRYFITSTPTLLAFSRQEAQLKTKITSIDEMKDREFLKLWIEDEARRGGSGGAGGSGLFGGLFGLGER